MKLRRLFNQFYFGFTTLTGLLILLLSVILIYPSYNQIGRKLKNDKFDDPLLFIGIISSPDHFKERQSLRETWLQLLPDFVKYKFVIGNSICNIHPKDRKTVLSCEKQVFEITNDVTDGTLYHVNSVYSSDELVSTGYGFSFNVNYPIIIQYLGIKQNSLNKTDGKLVRVLLSDAASQSNIASVTFQTDSVSDTKGYIFKKLRNPIILPKDFEGDIITEGLDVTNCSEQSLWDHKNFININYILTTNSSFEHNLKHCLLSTFSFTIKDVEQLKEHIEETEKRKEDWYNHMEMMYSQVGQEAANYDDILFLEMTEFYRNLPKKLLLFLDWIHENYPDIKFVLKTDDDSFIDLLRVEEELSKASVSDWDWWSCFRVGWNVSRRGKWKETTYPSSGYPPFPSGAGYILSRPALLWLWERKETLSTSYQGEDVAVGIWLEQMKPRQHVGKVCHWACNEQCQSLACNIMQLTVKGIYNMWKEYKICGNKICQCPES